GSADAVRPADADVTDAAQTTHPGRASDGDAVAQAVQARVPARRPRGRRRARRRPGRGRTSDATGAVACPALHARRRRAADPRGPAAGAARRARVADARAARAAAPLPPRDRGLARRDAGTPGAG